MAKKIKIEYQYFHGCPNADILLESLTKALAGLEEFIEFSELIVDTNELAMKIGFLGSPTIRINEKDLLGSISFLKPSLSCRFYPNGLPTIEFIREKIENEIKCIN